jgi:hypothetical protein
MKMTPADSGEQVSVRYSRGEAFMVSAGERGAILLEPVRYNGSSNKVLFRLAGYNRAGVPINFGTENVFIGLDDGRPLPIYDFDTMRNGFKRDAEQARMVALVEAAANSYAAYRTSKYDEAAGAREAAYAIDTYDMRLHSIAENLAYKVRTAKHVVLQTTTIDPASYWAGFIIADEPELAPGEVRRMTVRVQFAGETHSFSLFLAPQGTPTPPQISLPAVTRHDGVELLHGTPQTWLWDVPLPAKTRVSCYDSRSVRYCPGGSH